MIEQKEKLDLMDTVNLDDVIANVLSLKKKSFTFPREGRIFTKEMENVSSTLKHFPFDIKCSMQPIKQNNKIALMDEVNQLLSLLYEEKKEDKLRRKMQSFLNRVEIKEDANIPLQNCKIVYKKENKPIVDFISTAPLENVVQSISLATTIIGAMKNENEEEFSDFWRYNYTIPFFLEEYFAKKICRESQDILKIVQFSRMSFIQMQNNYYRQICDTCFHESTGANFYKAKMHMICQVYPNIKGYIDALKLLKIIQTSDGNVKLVLKQIKCVLEHTKTTRQILKELKVDKVDSRDVVKEHCQLMMKKMYR